MTKAQRVSARETKRNIARTTAYGKWCGKHFPDTTYEESLFVEMFHRYDKLDQIVDAYFLLSPVAFQAAWRNGFNSIVKLEGQTPLPLDG